MLKFHTAAFWGSVLIVTVLLCLIPNGGVIIALAAPILGFPIIVIVFVISLFLTRFIYRRAIIICIITPFIVGLMASYLYDLPHCASADDDPPGLHLHGEGKNQDFTLYRELYAKKNQHACAEPRANGFGIVAFIYAALCSLAYCSVVIWRRRKQAKGKLNDTTSPVFTS